LPGPGAVAADSDVYTKVSVLLEGEQNIKLPCLGCEQYATPCAPHSLSFSPFVLPPLETVAHGTAPGEGVSLVPRAAPYLEVLKPPDWNEPPLEEPGGVPLGLVHAAEKAGAEAIERAVVDAHEPGRASSDAHAAPAPTEGTASVEPASGAVETTVARPEALEPKAESAVWCVLETPPPPSPLPPQKDSGGSRTPPREAPSTGTRRHVLEALPPSPRGGPSKVKRGPQRAPRETPRAGVLAAHEGAPPVLRDTAPGLPKHGPPWDIEGELGGTTVEAENEGDAFDHRTPTSVTTAPLTTNNYVPWARTRHRHPPLKSPTVPVLRPIERAHGWRRRRRRWRRGHIQLQHVTPPSHARLGHAHTRASHAGRITSRARRIKQFPPLHERCISSQSPDCVRNEGECRTQRVCAHVPVFGRARSSFCLVHLRLSLITF
jgi:hypothetical protein